MSAVAQTPGGSPLAPITGRRKVTDTVMRGLLAAGTLIALVPLALVIYYLVYKGIGAWSWGFFTSDPTGSFLGDQGGIKSALLGTIEMVLLASVIAIPIGWGVALYLVEFGRTGRFGSTVRYFIDVMTGVPSIVFGLFIYVTLVIGNFGGASFAGWKGSIALALLVLPVVTRSAEVVLLLVPDPLREAALALGTPRWRVTLKVVLPTALPGLITGSLLAVARAAGETAPLLFTATIVNGTTFNLGDRMNSLPVQIYTDISSPNAQIVQRAWGSALALVTLILLTTLIARLASRRSRL
jgi:phosphate transport system permease protein